MSFRLVLGAWVVLSLLTALPAFAQSTRRPDLNPFGRGFRDSSQSLSASGSLGATFFDAIERRTAPVEGQQVPDHGWGTFASGALTYRLNFPNLDFNASVGAVAVYYPAIGPSVRTQLLPNAGTGLGWTFALTDKTSLRVGSGVSFRPAYAERLWAGSFGGRVAGRDGMPEILPPDTTHVGGSYLAVDSGAGLTHVFSRRWRATADYGYGRDFLFQRNDAASQDRRGRGWSQQAGSALHFLVTRNLSVRGGYRYNETHFPNRPTFRSHSADAGIDFGDGGAIQLGPGTVLAFAVGASSLVSETGQQRYHLTGNVNVTHALGRTWSSRVGYNRGVSSNEILFNEPVLRDTVTASLQGLVSRQTGFHATARVSHGSVGFTGGDNGHTTIAVSTGLQRALHRQVAVSVDYTYYQHRFGTDVAAPAGLSDRSASQGVHAYLSLWAPIFQRRPNAAR